MGKLNYYLGGSTAATTDGRTNNRYADIDFCKNPEAICSDSRTMELRWIVALFEWVERIQSYNDDNGWNYMEQLHAVMEGDLLNDLKFEQNHFIDAVGGIVHQGCPSPPCDKDNLQRVHLARERKANFKVVLEALELPVRGAIFREMELHLITVKQDFEDVILLSKTPNPKKGGKTMHQSYRYHFADFIESLRLMSDIGFEGNQFYIGQSSSDGGGGGMDMNAGMFNIAMFLTQAVVMSIQDDACDEVSYYINTSDYFVFYHTLVVDQVSLFFSTAQYTDGEWKISSFERVWPIWYFVSIY